MQLQPIMRKRVNILFVALATCSVVYGMILKYNPNTENSALINEVPASTEEVVSYDDDVVDLDALDFGNPD